MSLVKEAVKKSLTSIFGRKLLKMDNRFFEKQIVSFDVFDTLIYRKCGKPKAIFDIIEKKSQVKEFAKLRSYSEKEARKNKGTEINLDDIYQLICETTGYSKAEELKHIEIETEFEQCCPNEEMISLLFEILRQNRQCILISDMYLSKDIIFEMLNKNGISGYEKLYVSSEYKQTKRNGKLFIKAIEENKIKKTDIIHIGDDLLSDFIIPKMRVGIDTFLYKR